MLTWCRALVGVALNVSLGYVEKKAAEDGLRNQDVLRDAALGMMGNVIHSASRAVAFLEFTAQLNGLRSPTNLCQRMRYIAAFLGTGEVALHAKYFPPGPGGR